MNYFNSRQAQTAFPIRLPTLGQKVKLGYVYNYNEDTIAVLNDLKAEPGPGIVHGYTDNVVELSISTSKNLNDFKWKQLQLNNHLRSSILTGLLASPLWFSEFLDVYSKAGSKIAGKIFAVIAVHILVRKSQDHTLFDSNLKAIVKEISSKRECKNISHVVSTLVYGFNAILTFQVEVSNSTEKKDIEACMYLEAKGVFCELTSTSNSNDSLPPSSHPISWLKKAKFQFYSDRTFPSAGTYEDILSHLKNAIINGNSSTDYVPVEMTLSPINNDTNQTRDLDSDSFIALLQIYAKMSAIREQYQLLMTDPLLIIIPHLQPRVVEFKEVVVDEHFKETSQTLRSAVKSYRKDNQTQSQFMMVIGKRQLAMEEISHWFFARQHELSLMRTLLKDVNINWTTDLQTFYQEDFQDHVQVFLFKTQEVIETISNTDGCKVLKPTVYAILSANETARQKFRENILKFSTKTQKKNCLLYLSPAATNCHITGSVSTINNQQENSMMDEESITEHNCDSRFTTPTSNLDEENMQIVHNKQLEIFSTPIQSNKKQNKSNPFNRNITNIVAPKDPHSHQTKDSSEDVDSEEEHGAKSEVASPTPTDTKYKEQPEIYAMPILSNREHNKLFPHSLANFKATSSSYTNILLPPKYQPNIRTENVESKDNKQSTYPSPTLFEEQNESSSQYLANSNDFKSYTKNSNAVEHYQTKSESVPNPVAPTYQHKEPEILELESSPSNDCVTTQPSPSSTQVTNLEIDDNNDESDEILERNPTTNYTDISNSLNKAACPSIAKQFAERCKILEKGEPTIYMLEAHERESNKNLRWFEIRTKPNPDEELNDESRKHKILILMGATGAGKSTLINGMINYILGVEWDDSFRFKIVKDLKSDGATGKEVNQAYSQTSCVTAYTIHHVEGMKIPYDITIIDTPGYGDTQGIKQDLEITRQIEEFLVHPQTSKEFNYVNAVCFVANAAESRLTHAQQYVFQSITSIFGNDVRQNLQLLVTFSDGNKPPVLEAVRLAKIPGLSDQPDCSVEHHKFNSSALYAQNSCADNFVSSEKSFQMGFWKLGMENFKLFFHVLATMPNRSWEQTRQVILNRGGIKKSQQKILLVLDIYLKRIKQVKSSSLNVANNLNKLLEAYKCYEKKEDSIKKQVPLQGKSYFMYNCRICKISCKPIYYYTHEGRSTHYSDDNCLKCTCHASKHDRESYEWISKPDEDYENKRKVYESCKKSKELAEEELKKSKLQLADVKKRIMELFQSIEGYTRFLESSTLNNSPLTVVDHINSIVSDLESKKQEDYLDRVERLKNLFKQYEDENVGANNQPKTLVSFPATTV